jgi:ABC-type amino acid transport substrate-binding protein
MQRRSARRAGARRVVMATCVILLFAAPRLFGQEAPGQSGTLDRIRDAGRVKLGYRTEARPFSYRDESGQAAGYSVALCQQIVDALRREPGYAGLSVEWVPVTSRDSFSAWLQRQVDLLCAAEAITLAKRSLVSFSIPIFPGGIGALVRADAPARLREVLSGRGQVRHPTWRASALQALQARAFSAIEGTTAEKWLTERIKTLEVIAATARVSSYDAGVRAVLDRRSDAFFGERAALLDAAGRRSARDLIVLDRLFTYEPLALAFERGDEDLRLLVDRALSRFYGSTAMVDLYTKWFGEPDDITLTFFRWNRLPE